MSSFKIRTLGLCCVVWATVFGLSAKSSWSQARGFQAPIPASDLTVGRVLQHWQAIQDDLRATIGQDRRPEYKLNILAHCNELDQSKVEQIQADQLPPRIILVLGGLQGLSESAERFAVALGDCLHQPTDTRMAVFSYPNDGSIAESGEVLRGLLIELQKKSPNTKVSIVSHSMGGLVARTAIEPTPAKPNLPETELHCVDQLVMICPPNHGSVLAQYADALEFTDALRKIQVGSQTLTEVFGSLIDDGLGEACEELVPHCDFLRSLNSRPRAPGVRYSIIAGTGGPITPLVRLASSVAFRETKGRTRIDLLPEASDLLARADELLLSDEFAQGMGDGAVSVASARLEGVSEFSLAPVNHGEWAQLEKPSVQALVQTVSGLLVRKPTRASF